MNASPIVELFMALVRIPSPSGREEPVARFIRQWLTQRGVSADHDRAGERNDAQCGNLIATVPGRRGAPRLLFVAHMDTVETGETAIGPLLGGDGVIRSAGDTILGADNKSGVAAVMGLLVASREIPAERRPTVHAAFTTREESGMMGASLLDVEALGVDCAFCVDGSQPIGTAVIGALGQSTFNVAVHGRAAHAAASPQAGIDALRVLGEIIAGLPHGRQRDGGSVNVSAALGGAVASGGGAGTGTGGSEAAAAGQPQAAATPGARRALAAIRRTPTNLVPAEALLRGEVRAYREAAMRSILGQVEDVVARVCAAHGARYEWLIDHEHEVPPFPPAEESPALERFKAAVATFPELEYASRRAPITLEANYLAPMCPTVALASGGRAPHATTEHIATVELEQLERLLVEIVRRAGEGEEGREARQAGDYQLG